MSSHTPGAMDTSKPQPNIEILAAEPQKFAAVPSLNFTARVDDPSGRQVYTIALNCQIVIDPARRSYDDRAREALVDLFGEPGRWGATTRRFLWTKVDVLVKSFTDHQTFEIPVACSFDTELAAVKYFYSLEDGEIPLNFMFTGTIFYRGDGGELKLIQVPWSCDARFTLPVSTWRALVDHFYPNRAWVAVQRETLDALRAYQANRGLPSLEASITELMAGAHARTGEER